MQIDSRLQLKNKQTADKQIAYQLKNLLSALTAYPLKWTHGFLQTAVLHPTVE